MALIECPECGKNISDKAEICIGCGFPIKEHLNQVELERVEEEKVKREFFCDACNQQNEIGSDYCVYCGNRLTQYNKTSSATKEGTISKECYTPASYDIEEKQFNGIYKYTLFGGKQEVYCPRCGSENCSHYQEQVIIPGKTKTRYTANLNPLKPFTLVNKKEKVVRKESIKTESKFLCNSCGKIFT